jgi:hypothetical protein
MRTQSGRQGPGNDSRSKDSALTAQQFVLCFALGAVLFALCAPGEAQQREKVP